MCDQTAQIATQVTEGGERMDSQIIALLQKRDESALEELRAAYGGLCFRIAEQMLGSREDAEECVNDMLLGVWNSIPPNQPESLEAYVVTLCRRAAVRKLRSQGSLKRGGREYTQALDELADILPAEENVEQTAEIRELTDALAGWLRGLEPMPRYIFMQRYYLAESVQAIADKTGMRVSAVKMTLLRTRKKLKAFLREEGLL